MVIPGWMCADRGFDWQPLARIAHSSSLVKGFWFVYLASVAPLGPLILFTTPSMTCSAAASTLLHVQRKTRLEFHPLICFRKVRCALPLHLSAANSGLEPLLLRSSLFSAAAERQRCCSASLPSVTRSTLDYIDTISFSISPPNPTLIFALVRAR